MTLAQETDLTTPQPEHKLLQRFSGEWRFEKKSASDDGSEPSNVGTGKVTAELLGDFFVVCRWQGRVYDNELNALQTLGYDVGRQRYSGVWIDSTMSYRWEFSGPMDKDSRELIVVATGPGPAGGTSKFRERYQFESADSITIIAEMLQGEKWIRFMTTHLTRNK